MSAKWRRVVVFGCVLTLAGCDLSGDEIAERHAHWLNSRPASYAYTVQISGWREPELLEPKRITVTESEISSVVYAWASARHLQGASAPRNGASTIDGVFEELGRAAAQGAYVRARFDGRWGFVERAFIEGGTSAESWDVEIREFESLGEALPAQR